MSKKSTHEDTHEEHTTCVGTCVASCVVAPHLCLILRCVLMCVLTCGPPPSTHGVWGSTSLWPLDVPATAPSWRPSRSLAPMHLVPRRGWAGLPSSSFQGGLLGQRHRGPWHQDIFSFCYFSKFINIFLSLFPYLITYIL